MRYAVPCLVRRMGSVVKSDDPDGLSGGRSRLTIDDALAGYYEVAVRDARRIGDRHDGKAAASNLVGLLTARDRIVFSVF